MKKYRIRYCGIKDFDTKKEADRFIKKETYEIIDYLKYIKKNGGYFLKGKLERYPYGKVVF